MAEIAENGVHEYMAEGYVEPKEPEVKEHLEWFQDQKLALMMHWGIYSQPGLCESWPLVDYDIEWSRNEVDYNKGDDFKKEYVALNKSFNPVRFQPEKWAQLAEENGFKYLLFTTKHHDGFCMYDSKYSDYKITAPDCPFHTNRNADVVRAVFDAFRARGLGIACYFSKPDWHSPDFWDNCGVGVYTNRYPTYDIHKDPERWERFCTYTKNQILELMQNYGKIDVLWLDGGWICRRSGYDIHIEDIVAEARKTQPWLISADRTCGGTCENVITPEQTIPPLPLNVPWESCITMGRAFSYRFDDNYKSPRELIHMLLDIVAKGGNLALNVAPQPDGRLPVEAVKRMKIMGAWLKNNGEGIYGTRVAAPYRKGDWAFTQKAGKVYAFRMWKDGEKNLHNVIPVDNAAEIKQLIHVPTGMTLPFTASEEGLVFDIPPKLPIDEYADAFRLEK